MRRSRSQTNSDHTLLLHHPHSPLSLDLFLSCVYFPHVCRTLFNHARSPRRRSGIICFTTRPSVQRAATEYFNFRRQKGWLGLAGLCKFPDPKAPMGLWVQHPGQGGQGRRPLRPDDQKARRCRHSSPVTIPAPPPSPHQGPSPPTDHYKDVCEGRPRRGDDRLSTPNTPGIRRAAQPGCEGRRTAPLRPIAA